MRADEKRVRVRCANVELASEEAAAAAEGLVVVVVATPLLAIVT